MKSINELIDEYRDTKYRVRTINIKEGQTPTGIVARRVRTPIGEFDSTRHAAVAYNVISNTIINWISKKKDGFSYIDKEQE